MRICALLTVYNEEEFVDYALRSAIQHFDHVVVVEGAYQETLETNPGITPRSSDGTLQILQRYQRDSSVTILHANERSDPQQRTYGLNKIIELGYDWCVIVDGDEIWDEEQAAELRERLENCPPNITIVRLKIQVFVNDFWHYTWQTMPRCFRVRPGLRFVGDNLTQDMQGITTWESPTFHHYAYCKSPQRFIVKKKWWAARGGSDWFMDSKGLYSSPNHLVWEYTGDHPDIMLEHPRYTERKI